MKQNLRCRIREAQKDKDEEQTARILSECFGPISPRQLSQWLDKPDIKDFVCEVEGKIVSHIDIEFKSLHFGEGVYLKTGGIGGVCTCSEYRGKGIMTSMMQQTLDFIKSTGVSSSTLFTGSKLPAHRIYERCGFGDIQKWPSYVKILDFTYVFRRWLRDLNRIVKVSNIAQRNLHGWNRVIILELREIGPQTIRVHHGHFWRLNRSSNSADLEIAASWETLLRIMWGGVEFDEAMETGEVRVKKGTEADLRVLRKILSGIWDERK